VVLDRKEIIIEREIPSMTPKNTSSSNKRALDEAPKRRKNRPDRQIPTTTTFTPQKPVQQQPVYRPPSIDTNYQSVQRLVNQMATTSAPVSVVPRPMEIQETPFISERPIK